MKSKDFIGTKSVVPYTQTDPVALYHMKDGKLHCESICVISDDMEHDTCFVYKVQEEVVKYLKRELPDVKDILYFSDACTGQYTKNYKNIINLCHHYIDTLGAQGFQNYSE